MKRVIDMFDRWWALFMAAVMVAVIFLQYHRDFGHLAYYRDYSRVIVSGLDPSASRFGGLTCPMWGYSLFVLVSSDKLFLLACQGLLGLAAVWFLARAICVSAPAAQGRFGRGQERLLKALIVLSLPLYAYNAMLGPQSVAANLLMISIAVLLIPGQRMPVRAAVVSGVALGLALNFRSDFILLPVPLALVMLARARPLRECAWRVLLWTACVYVMLAPWAVYTKRATGHALMTSTNSGHVLFCGLGGRPGNVWGVAQHDMDPLLLKTAQEKAGPGEPSCGYEGNRALLREWAGLVREYPAEYLKGCVHSLGQMAIGGVYSGTFDEDFFRATKHELRRRPLRRLVTENPFFWAPHFNFRVGLNLLSEMTGRLAVLAAFALFPFAVRRAIRNGDTAMWLIFVPILCQWAINMCVSNVRSYMTTVYVFYLVVVVYGRGGRNSSCRPPPGNEPLALTGPACEG